MIIRYKRLDLEVFATFYILKLPKRQHIILIDIPIRLVSAHPLTKYLLFLR